MKKTILLCIFLLSTFIIGAQVPHPIVWLRADSAVLNAPSWVDVSGNGLNATSSSGSMPAVFSRMNFNKCFGRTVAQYHPFPENTALYAQYNDSVTMGTATVTAYDILDRPVSQTLPYDLTTSTDYGFGATGGVACFRTTVTDPMGNAVTTLKGGLDQQLKMSAPQNTITLFGYDPLGRLTASTDPDGFTTMYDYDLLGRMTHRTHPDAGEDWYEYDPAGNLTYHVNGNGDTVRKLYYFNLLTDILYPRYPANNVKYWYGTQYAFDNCAGKVALMEDGSGLHAFKYGKLGEVTEETRIFVLPNEHQTYTFRMSFSYDSWNRIRHIFYPDSEVVDYHYDWGGMLQSIYGDKNGDVRTYVEDISYNTYGLKETVLYGNGARNHYQYDMLMRLSHLHSENGQGEVMQEIDYLYDSVENITDIDNHAGVLSNGLGGSYWSHYDYDGLYRLTHAEGEWNGSPFNYNMDMQYFRNGRIKRKELYANVLDYTGDTSATNYANIYLYNAGQPNTLDYVTDDYTGWQQNFSWDAAGNMTNHDNFEESCTRNICWDEENRLIGFSDCHNAGFYQYDASGERTYKLTGGYTTQNIQGHWWSYNLLDNPTLYYSPYLVATPKGYTKHYYAESERIASRIGGGGLADIAQAVVNIGTLLNEVFLAEEWLLWDEDIIPNYYGDKQNASREQLTDVMMCASTDPLVEENRFVELRTYWHDNEDPEPDCYWYHPDHLGSSSWITYTDGSAVQHLHYLPWGEDFVDQRTTNWHARHTLLRKREGLGNRPILLWRTLLQLRFEHLVECRSASFEISVAIKLCLLQ